LSVIIVSSLRHIDRLAAEHSFTRSLSLLAPWQKVIFQPDVLPRERVILAFNDVTAPSPDHVAPDADIVAAILAFGRACAPGETSLIHCWMGISRSPAAAYIIACERAPGGERALAQDLRRRSPTATPNRLLVALADDTLARGGRMVEAIDAIGRGAEVDAEAPPFALPLAVSVA
jgi:predicted protein tyrosine phosphatase